MLFYPPPMALFGVKRKTTTAAIKERESPIFTSKHLCSGLRGTGYVAAGPMLNLDQGGARVGMSLRNGKETP